VLEPGHSETGAWIVTDSGREPQLPPKYASGEISFPIPLKEKLGEFAVHFVNREEEELNEKEGAKIPPEQPEKGIVGGECTTEKHTELVEHPVAEPGNLCAYAGFEELLPAGDAAFFDLVTARGTAGADLGGSNIVFEFNEQTAAGAKKGHIRVQGSWAVAE
jgi:hypothetical protein